MYLRKFNQESLSKHRAMFSTICLSLSLSILVSQPVMCLASDREQEPDRKRVSALARWELIELKPTDYVAVPFKAGSEAYAFNTKLLQTYNDEVLAAKIAQRESVSRSLTLVDALQAYRVETAKKAWAGNKSLQEMLTLLMNQNKIIRVVVPNLLVQNSEMREHIAAVERMQEEEKMRAATTESSVSVQLSAQIKERDEELIKVRKQLSLEAEAKRAADAAALEIQGQLDEKDVEIRSLKEQLRSIKAQQVLEVERQPEQQPVLNAHNGLTDGEALLLRAKVDFYKDRYPWYWWLWDKCWGNKPDTEKVRLNAV